MSGRDRSELSAAKRALLEKRLRGKAKATGNGEREQTVIRKRTGEGPLPLSFAQQRLWFLDQLADGENTSYNVPFVWSLSGPLHLQALERSLNEIVRRHEALRTVFVEQGGEPRQVVLPDLHVALTLHDVQHIVETEEREEAARHLMQTEIYRPFDLSRGPLLRAALVQVEAQRYLFTLTLHHIVADGWSVGVLMREFTALYEAFAADLPSPLPDVKTQYPDFTLWQREQLQTEAMNKQFDYWRNQLGGSLPVLELPTDHPRPAKQTFQGAAEKFVLSPQQTTALKEIGQQAGATLFMTLLTAFNALLHRYTGSEDLLIGSPVANRQLPEIEEMIGFLVNTLVLRTDLSGDPTFLDALARVKRMSLDAFAHQDVPFEQLVADLQPERDLSQSPLFNAMFVLVNTELEPLRLGGLIMTPLAFEFETAKYDLTLTMTEEGDQLVGWLEYNTDLWTEATARRMVQHLQQLLQAVPVDPRQRLSDLTLLTAEEERLLLSDWVATDADYPADLCLHQLFEQQAERTPQAVAVTFGERSLTYRELDRLADAWAVRLQAIGVGPDRPVGLSMERSVEMIVALLGILKAGGAYVPLDPEYPQERLSAIMADAQLHALVTQPHLQDRLPTRDRPLLHLDLQELQLLAKGEVATASRVQPDDLAYIIYTSGSTGKPKGVAMVHRALTNLMHVHQQQNTLPPEARTLQFTSLNFDVSVQDIFSTLCTGGTLVLVSDETRRDTHALYRYLIEQRIERLFLPFVALRHLAEVGAVTELVPDTLREVITAGEQLQITPEMRRFFSRLPQCTLRNDYGPSETHVVSQLELTGDPAQWPYLPSIGKALPNVALYVLDANGKPVPLGVPGELYVGGEVALARGYWQRPDLTQERFVPNPFAKREGARLYKTGDLVRYLPHGELEFLARVDQQVKIRGHRVELGEVEAILSEHPLLRAAAVSAPEDERGLKRLVAYVVPLEQEAGTQTNWADICREYLAERLPDYMVPSLFVPLDALPVNANGKLDRKALPALDLHQQQERAFVPPRTETERQVAAVFSAVLGIAEVSAHDDFFHLGGHSLLATQVISRLREAFAVPLSLKVIFQASTVEILARAIKGQLSDQTAGTANRTATLKTIPTVSREGHMPLSFAQQRLWFLDQFEGGRSATYNMPFVTRLEGALDVDVLERCLHEILRRHEALRTSFQVVDGEAVQVIAECAPLRIERFDLRDVEESVREQEALQRIEQEAHRPFDLTAGPLLRASLVQVGDDSHILLINLHHIASDGWSIGVLGRELSALYAAFTAGEPSPLPDLPIQYADFASWQRENMQGAEMEEQLAYWKRQLGGTLPVLQLPTDHPRPPKQTFNGTVREFRLSRALTDRLKQFSEREQATLFMTLLSAFQTLLARYSGQDDILVGTPIANRRHSEVEGLIGFFANTLAMRTDLSGDPTFCELVQRVKQVALDGYAHQDLPFEKMVEELQPDRDLSQSPLFRVMFVLVNTPGEALRLGDVKLRDVEMEHRTAKFDLTLFLTEDEQGLRGAFEYNTDLYEDATIRRMTEHLETLLQAVVADPTRRISELPLLPEAEKESLLQAGLGLAVAEREGCVHDRVAQVAGRTPDAVAVRFGERAMSYAELERRANRLAQRLQAEGIGRGHLVGICLPRSVEMMISVLAVLKAGGAYVPLDPSYPQERIDAILEEADLSLILAHDSVLPLLEKGEVATLLVGDGEEDEEAHQTSVYETQLGTHPETHHVAQADQSWGLPPVAPDDPAYVLFTSGSTGKPKGVTMHHRALRNLIAWQEAQSGILPAASTATSTATAAANTLQFTSLNFDVSFQEIFATWCAGGTLVLVSEDVRRDPEALLDTLIDQEVERLFLPFVALQQLADAAVAQKRIPSQLREVNTAGEQLQITDGIRAFFTQLPNCRLVNQYGPTESHVVTAYRMQGPVENWPSLPPIGRPIHNAAIYLLDDHLQPVPTGVVGELHIGGVSVAQGYLNQPDLTADKFIPNPFGGGRHNGDRLYKTGDLARFLPNGEIEYLGRRDQQVKIRGYRIELGEIESVLRQHSDVREAVVTAHEEGTGLKRLVAYVVGDTAQDLLLMKRSLHQHLAAKLPSFMIPSAYQLLDRLPVTPTGKVDRRALPTPDFSDSFSEKEYVAPRNEHEEITAHVFSQLLGVAQVGAHDSFFQLGGHSLLATQAVSRLRDLFAVDLPLQTLFEAPTVAGLARELKRLQRSESGRLSEWEQQPIPRRSPDDPAVLSYAQQRIWFLDQFEDDTASYNVPYVFRLLGDVDVSALERSLNHIVERHEALRTVFGKREGTPVPVLLPELHLMIPVHDLRDLSPEQRAQQQHDLTQAEVYRPFDLTVGPLFRLTLLHLQAGEYRLILNMHHIVSDGWSIGVLMKELAVCYEAYASGQRPLLPELPLQYADYALWQRNWLQGDVLQEQLDYWKTKLGGTLPVLELPTDKPRPSRQTFRGTVRTFTLSPDMTARLNQAAQQEGATLFMVLLAAFQTLLFRYSGQDDIVVGTPIANRKRSEIESLIGFFVNTLALRTDLSGNPAFSELIGRVREAALGAYAHQDVPFEKLVEELAPDRDMSQSPLFRVMFVLLNTPMPAFTWSGVQLIPDDFRSETAKFDLMLFLTEEEGALVGGFEYNTDIFAEETIARMVAHLENLLAAVLADPQQKIGDVTFFTEQEERLLLHEWVETQTSYPSEMCIHQLVEAQAQQTPQATALVYGSTSLTYAELDRRATELARHLQARGVKPDALVGICLERSVEMIVAVLGTLKAGGAYVPLDPTYPEERLRLIVEDAELTVLLTEESLLAQVSAYEVDVLVLDRAGVQKEGQEGHSSVAEIPHGLDASPREIVPEESLTRTVTSEHLAYVLYTSGSTGQPKGVAMPHRPIANLIDWHAKHYDLPPEARTLQFTSLNFDVSVQDIFATLGTGGTLVLIDEDTRRDSHALYQYLIEHDIARIFLPFVALQHLAAVGAEAERVPTSLREVVTAGEQLKITPEIRRFFSRLPACNLRNDYGPTETHAATQHVLSGSPDAWPALPCIGAALQNVELYVLDANRQPVPMGVPGELYIGGAGVSRGYLNRDDLTAERYQPHPFAKRDGERVYKTGDLVRYLPHGELEYLARIDQQVKIRGHRVELGEVEAVLNEHPLVREAVVTADEDNRGMKRLVAYVVEQAEEERQTDNQQDDKQKMDTLKRQLRADLSAILPDYMVPTAFVLLEVLPLTATGKLDRKALPAIEQDHLASAAYVAPSTPTEEKLAQIWSEVLRVEQVGRHGHFFELGGHSLLATQVMARVQTVFGVQVRLFNLFAHPTLERLATCIDEEQGEESRGATLPDILPDTRSRDEGYLPLSFAQKRLWFLNRFQEGDDATYNMPFAFRLRGALHVAALEQSLQTIVDHHEALRTTFTQIDGEPMQVIHEHLNVPLTRIDLRELAQEHREAEAQQLFTAESYRPFDLEKGPLVRASLVQIGEADFLFQLNLHHIVTDGWSNGVLMRQLSDLYASFAQGEKGSLPELPIQYADYTLWQRDWLQGDVLAEQIAYWKRQLAGPLPVLELPTARPRPPQQTFNGTVQQVSLSQEIMERLTHVGQKQGATLFMTLLAAFKSLLHRYTGQEDIIVGTPIANRRHPKLEELIGFFVNTLAMRTDLSGDPTFAELVENVRQVALDAYAYQDVPFEKLVEELQPDRDISQSPLFRVMFILQNTGEQQLRLPGVEIEGVDFVTKTAKFDLILYFVQQEDGLHGGVEYNTDLFDGETMARMMGHFVNLLEAIVADPGRKVSELRMLSQAEEKMLLQEWNRSGEAEHGAMSGVATPVSDADNDAANATNATNAAKRIDDLISLQAALTPDEVAVVYEDDVLTYRQLDERANQLAHVLQELGVGADRFVGLYLERSTDMIVGLLAVLKAGGAYLPLDASYPQERLSFILEDTQAPVILTHTSLRDRLPSGIWQAVCLDSEETLAILDAKSTLAPASNSTESNLAYAIYTSGSTGKPKGVLIEHRNAMHCFNGLNQLFDVSAQEAVLAVASIGFDITVHELIWSLTRGIKLVLLAREEVLQAGESASPYSLAAQARRHRVTRLVCTPTLMNQLLSKEEVVDSLSSVHTLCLGGEALTPALLSLVHRTLPVARLFNLYGPTEAAVWSTAHEVVQEVVQEDHEVQTVSIGRALPGTRLYVLDRHGQPVPLGVPGELCIGGDGVARGYLNRPDLTAARFIPNPFVKDGEDRLYKTGDLVRYRADGTLLFLGRIDHQVKIKGHRIELGEIESVLNRHPQVRESAVVARPDSQGALRLVAYVAPVQAQTQQTPLQATDLRRYLQAELPDYMVPAFWEVLDRLPTTHSGKIDRNALPDPSGERQEASGYVAPRDRFEFEMVGLWEEVLQTRPIGVLDNFFALGGESFRAVRLTAEAKRRLGVSLPLSLLFQTPTVAELCAQLRNGEEEEVTANLLPIRLPVEGRGEAPLFLFHPYRGGVLCYAPLAHALGEEVPIYGLQAVGFSSDEEPLDDIGAMAERYLHEIRQRQPHGPYRLAGWSMGGLIAYETAKRLELEGEQVEYLGLIDTAYTVRDDSLAAYDWMDESLRLQAYAAQQFPTESEQVAKADVVQAYDYLLQQAKTHQVLPPHATLDMLKRDIKLVIAHALAQARYTCEGGVQADIHLYHVTETEDRYGVPLVAPEQWEASTSGQVKAIELPGHHFSLVEPPHVTQLAQAMQAALHKVTT